jgi:hypothetical protein
MWHVRAKREINNVLWQGKPFKGDRFEDLGVEGRIILNWIFKK